MRRLALASALLAASFYSLSLAAEPAVTFTKLWTHGHNTAGQVSIDAAGDESAD